MDIAHVTFVFIGKITKVTVEGDAEVSLPDRIFTEYLNTGSILMPKEQADELYKKCRQSAFGERRCGQKVTFHFRAQSIENHYRCKST